MKIGNKTVVLIIACSLIFYPLISYSALIAVVKSKDLKPYIKSFNGFKSVVDAKYSEFILTNKKNQNRSLLSKIKSFNPNLIFGLGAKASYLLKDFNDVPLVFSMVSNPAKANILTKNVTGVRLDIPFEDKIKIYNEIIPGIKNIGVIYSSKKSKDTINEAKKVFKKNNLNIIAEQINSIKDIPKAIDKIMPKIDTLWLLFDPVVTSSPRILREIIILRALRDKKPVIGFNKWAVTQGALFCLYVDFEDLGKQAGQIASKILYDKLKPSDIPMEAPKAIKTFFNAIVAERINDQLNVPGNAYLWRAK